MTVNTHGHYLDPETDLPHIYNHGVDEEDVEAVLAQPGEDRQGRDDSRVALGQNIEGRFLKVIYVPEPEGAFVITAYDLVGKPLTAYRRRQRRRL